MTMNRRMTTSPILGRRRAGERPCGDPQQKRRIKKMKAGFEGWTYKAMALALLGVSLAISGCAAGGAHCMTERKEGLQGYNTYSRWVCVYDEGMSAGNVSAYRTTEPLSSVCALKMEGRLKNIDSAFGGGSIERNVNVLKNFVSPGSRKSAVPKIGALARKTGLTGRPRVRCMDCNGHQVRPANQDEC